MRRAKREDTGKMPVPLGRQKGTGAGSGSWWHRLPACVLLLWLVPGPLWAACSHGTVGTSSTAIVGTADVTLTNGQGLNGRHYFFIQDTGANNMNVAIGSNNNATSKDVLLTPGESWVMTAQGGALVPGGDVAAISASGTSYAFCDF